MVLNKSHSFLSLWLKYWVQDWEPENRHKRNDDLEYSVVILFSFLSTVEGVVLRPELRHLSRWQIHRDRIRWQEGHRLRGHLLERKRLPLCFSTSTEIKVFSLTNRLRAADFSKCTRGNQRRCRPEDACTGKKWTFFRPFVFGFIFGLHFFDFFLSSRIFGCNLVKQRFIVRNSFPRHLVQSVHIGINKTFYIYYKNIYIFMSWVYLWWFFFSPPPTLFDIWVGHENFLTVLRFVFLKAHSAGWSCFGNQRSTKLVDFFFFF